MESERLIGNDKDLVMRSPPVGLHETPQVLLDLLLGAPVHGERGQLARQPLVHLVVPVLDQAAGGHHHSLVD